MLESKIDIANITFTHPSDWNVIKIKYLLSTKVTDGPHETPTFIDEGYPFLSVDSIVDGKLVFEGCRYISKEDYDKYKLKCDPQKDDIFMGKAASIGKIAIVDVDFNFSIWSPLALLRPNQNIILPKYLEFALKSDYAQDQIDLYSTSNTQKNISMDDIPRIELLVPNIEQQKAITNYLIKQTAKIDATIAKNEELIQLLEEKRVALINQVVTKGLNPDFPMKDSGVEWIGEIPEHAEIIPFRRICNLNQGLQYPQEKRLSEKLENSLLYITVKYLNSKEKVEEYIPNPTKRVICTEDDVLLARTGATGEVFTNLNGVFHNNFFRVNYNKKIYKDYLVYYLEMDSLKKILLLKAGVTTIPDLNHDSFLETPFILYEFDEQQQIANYLDKETLKIDTSISKIQKNIKLLEEYKTSLIHHVVTGKIDVRSEEI